MADNTIQIELTSKLAQAKQDVKDIQAAGGLSGPGGAKALNKIQAILTSLEGKDISKLDSEGLKQYLNEFAKLNRYIQSAGRGLSTFSDAYVAQQKKVEQANERLSRAQDKESEALKKQEDALKKFSESKATFYNDKGHKVSNPETVADLYSKNKLDIRDQSGKTSLTGAALKSVEGTISGLSGANKDVEVAQQEVKAAQATLKIEKATLEGMPSGGQLHPTTATVDQHAAANYDFVNTTKDTLNENQVASNKDLNDSIGTNINLLNKQSTSLGKAFRQFSIYAIALRTVKKALHEAARTIKEIDRALTEQAMVTGLTRKQTYGLLKDYQNMAARLGTTTKEVSSTMTEFLRQGRSIAEASKLTEAAVAAAKVAGISAADSINYLTTAINGFQLSADEAMKVSDKFAAVAATAATSYEEIAVALSKVAAQANLAGMSIDYTTALLTKGIETTREAPETIGTALKTVIARMRELTDYGETLEGDVNINNVEAQLGYIGIQLRDNNGELRSTEDVLNDLGEQWDDLNANQQAAIAKALAGTRQQSRLIAMMSDYERVIELQEIAERSQGATMAQMATYLEGMDAAMNKVSNAWEKIISTIVNNDFVIGLVDTFATILNNINAILSQTWGMVTAITIVALTGVSILGNKMKQLELARLQKRYTLEENKLQNQKNIAITKENIEKLKVAKQNAKAKLDAALERKAQLAKLAAVIQERKLKGAIVTASEAWLKKEQAANEAEIAQYTTEYNQATANLNMEQSRLSIMEKQESILNGQSSLISSIGTGIVGMLVPLAGILGFIKAIKIGMAAAKVYQEALNKGLDKQAAKEARNNALAGAGMFAKVVAAFASLGPWGVVAGIALGAALAAAIGVAIAAATGNLPSQKQENEFQKNIDNINTLSKTIFDLNKKFNALDSAIKKFDDLDNKVIKTKEDLQEMGNVLDSAADSLTEDEKAVYDGLQTQRAKRDYLAEVQKNAKTQLQSARNQQRQSIISMRNAGGNNWERFLTSNEGSIVQARDAMYALNNAALYDYIDKLKETKHWSNEAATATQRLTEAMLENLAPQEAAKLLDNPSKIKKYVDTIAEVRATYKDVNGNLVSSSAASILDSDDRTIKERVEAFREIKAAISALGDDEMLQAFIEANNSWANLSEAFSSGALDYMDRIGATNKAINEFANAIQDLGYNSKESAEYLSKLFDAMENGERIGDAIQDIFGYDLGSEEYKKILDSFDKNFGTTILNMGQNIDKFKNTIDDFYKKAAEWSTMSQTDKTAFLAENQDLFSGEDGQKLLDAFNSGNYAAIEAALAKSTALDKQRLRALEDINRQLEIEWARAEDERNYAYIQQLEDYKRELEETNKLYLASLETRYEQQQSQLDMYKEMLQKENDALTESLDKRKEAYQKYFDAINQETEDEDYEEQAQLLISNISKLSSSTNADAMAKTADLQKQLEELEKERLQTLRERAQEQILQNMEDEVTKISENLEKLLNNEQALLNAMLNDKEDPSKFIASMISAEAFSGNNTELGMQTYLEQMRSTFASIMPDIDWNNVDVERDGDTLILNIEGKEIVLSEGEQQNIYDAIQEALKQIGR